MSEQNNLTCPGCGVDLGVAAKAEFAPELLTVAYKLEPGRLMIVEDFCESLAALAKALKISGKELGSNVIVGLHALEVKDGEVSATVAVVLNAGAQ